MLCRDVVQIWLITLCWREWPLQQWNHCLACSLASVLTTGSYKRTELLTLPVHRWPCSGIFPSQLLFSTCTSCSWLVLGVLVRFRLNFLSAYWVCIDSSPGKGEAGKQKRWDCRATHPHLPSFRLFSGIWYGDRNTPTSPFKNSFSSALFT